MSGLTRATELISRPVVTMAGDALAEVKDVVYDSDEGSVLGFTLNRRGWLGKPLDRILAADAIASIGRDAIMIADPDVLVGRKEAPPEVVHAPAERNVIGNRVLTKSGTELGEVIDVARLVGRRCHEPVCDVVTSPSATCPAMSAAWAPLAAMTSSGGGAASR